MGTTTRHLHFSEEELSGRRRAACQKMREAGIDALLMFRQESMYYLTGYDTFGYVHFQCCVMTSDGRLMLLTRSADRLQARFTSVVEDIRVWVDRDGADPAQDLRVALEDLGLSGARLGVENDAYGLTARNGMRLQAALDGFAVLVDASYLVSGLRLVKSPAEIAYVRRAAELGDAAWEAAVEAAHAGVAEADVLARMHAAIFSGGGDDPANEFIIGSGDGALMCRYFTGRRTLSAQDQLTLEFAGTYRHYHSALMRTIAIGTAPPRQHEMWSAGRDALLACEDAARPGATFGDVFAAHAHTLDAAGLGHARLNACGYSLGATYAPNWMDWPMLYEANPVVIQPGMVIFMHMIIFDETQGLAATLGRTSLISADGAEPLSRADLDLVVN